MWGSFDYLRITRDNHKPLPTWTYSQGLSDVWSEKIPIIGKEVYRNPNPTELRIQMMSVLAAGSKGIMLFQSAIKVADEGYAGIEIFLEFVSHSCILISLSFIGVPFSTFVSFASSPPQKKKGRKNASKQKSIPSRMMMNLDCFAPIPINLNFLSCICMQVLALYVCTYDCFPGCFYLISIHCCVCSILSVVLRSDSWEEWRKVALDIRGLRHFLRIGDRLESSKALIKDDFPVESFGGVVVRAT